MPLIIQHLFAIGGFQGILLFCLLSFGAHNSKANRILGVWCLCLGVFFLGILLHIQTALNPFSFLIAWPLYLPAAYGALLYLYCRHAITDKPLSKVDLLHLLPVLSCYLLNIDLLFASVDVKLAWATGESSGEQSLSSYLSYLLTYVQAYVYLGFSIFMVRKFQRQANDNLANFNPHIFPWVWALLIITTSVWTLKVISNFSPVLYALSVVSDIIIIFMIYGVALAQWRDPKLFTINKIEQYTTNNNDDKPLAEQPILKSMGALDISTKELILQQAQHYIEDNQAFTLNELTLPLLAEKLEVSTHHLSEAINHQAGKNFYQFINHYRIDFICQQLERNTKMKIIDLAFAAGFSSKSTFNAVFKQIKGCSPTQYKKRTDSISSDV